MKITLENLNEEFDKIVLSSNRETAIKWFKQRLVDIINNPATSKLDSITATAALSTFSEFYSDGLN